MMRTKFKEKLKEELLEYIILRMRQIKEKFNEGLIENGKYAFWGSDRLNGVECPVFVIKDNDTVLNIPNTEKIFWFFDDNAKEITTEDFDFVKWCLDGFESWLEQMHAQVKKDEERIQEELNNSEAYMEYKSLKVIQKLEEK